ncbi:hypothetical protein BGW41_006263 [Actinomortierella wolfii]|nr:hypothetical protein BGW41_006263 [Actinomortierella wolfii]
MDHGQFLHQDQMVPGFSTHCGKTHAVIELPSQHQGFYFNTADNDWGSADMMTLYNTICGYLKDVQNSLTADDPETNNYYPTPPMMSLLH